MRLFSSLLLSLALATSLLAAETPEGFSIDLGDWTYVDGVYKSPKLPFFESASLTCTIPGLGSISGHYRVFSDNGQRGWSGYAGTPNAYSIYASTWTMDYLNTLWPIEVKKGTFTLTFRNDNRQEECWVEFYDITYAPAPKTVTVEFDALLGTTDTTTKECVPGEPYGELPTATREGATFLGWSTIKDYMNRDGEAFDNGRCVSPTDIVPVEPKTLYARWGITADKVINAAKSIDSIKFNLGEMHYLIHTASLWWGNWDVFSGTWNYETVEIAGYIPPSSTNEVVQIKFHGKGRLICEHGSFNTTNENYQVFIDGKEPPPYCFGGVYPIRTDGEHTLSFVTINTTSQRKSKSFTIHPITWKEEPIPPFISEEWVSEDYAKWMKDEGWSYPYEDLRYMNYISHMSDAHGLPIWMAYVTGVDPTTYKSSLKIKISHDENGKLKLSPDPDLGESRVYTYFGSNDLKTWEKIDGDADKYHFFKLSVWIKEESP